MKKLRLIDADKLKKQINNPDYTLYNAEMRVEYIEQCVDNAPTIESEPVRHGRWITGEMAIDSGCTSCSCCRSEYYIGDLQALEGDNDFVMYCPNCGAKMDGGN